MFVTRRSDLTDGKTLEHVGVIPDDEVLPTADDLASGRDPTLALAAERVGLKITPESEIASPPKFPVDYCPLPLATTSWRVLSSRTLANAAWASNNSHRRPGCEQVSFKI